VLLFVTEVERRQGSQLQTDQATRHAILHRCNSATRCTQPEATAISSPREREHRAVSHRIWFRQATWNGPLTSHQKKKIGIESNDECMLGKSGTNGILRDQKAVLISGRKFAFCAIIIVA